MFRISRADALKALREWDKIRIKKSQQTLSQKKTAIFKAKYPGIKRVMNLLDGSVNI